MGAVPDINNPTLEDALDETGYDKIIQLTNEESGSELFVMDNRTDDVKLHNESILIRPGDGLSRATLNCPDSEVCDSNFRREKLLELRAQI